MIKEEWRPIKGYEGFYEVSNKGRVRRLFRSKSGFRVLKPRVDRNGYCSVALHKGGERQDEKIHRLVAKEFIENKGAFPEINHKDGVKENNTTGNLEWCNRSQNVQHSYDNGFQSQKGEQNGNSRLTRGEVLAIKKHLCMGKLKNIEIANLYNIDASTICDIKAERTWKHISPKEVFND